MKKVFAIVVFLGVGLATSETAIPQQQVRIAYIGGNSISANFVIDEDFLQRAKRNGFNYIVAQFALEDSHWENGAPNAYFVSYLTSAYQQVDSYGMRLIPKFQFGNPHAFRWRYLNPSIAANPSAFLHVSGNCNGGNTIQPCEVMRQDGSWHINYMHYLGEDPEGIDGINFTYRELLLAINTAFGYAGLSYPLEYIHIGHDEPIVASWNSVNADTIVIGNSPVDQGYLAAFDANSNGFDQSETQEAIQSLLAEELSRRITVARDIFGSEIKLLIWGDAYDVEHGGGARTWYTLLSPHQITTAGALEKIYGGLRSSLVLMPWLYPQNVYPYGTSNNYETSATFDYFKNLGYQFIYAHEIASSSGYYAQFGVGGESGTRFQQLSEYINYGIRPEYLGYSLGYSSVHWADWSTPPPNSFLSMEFHSQWAFYHAAIFH